MNSNAVFWGIWKWVASAAVLFVALSITMSTCDAIEASKRRSRYHHITPADAAAGVRPSRGQTNEPLPNPEIDRILRGDPPRR